MSETVSRPSSLAEGLAAAGIPRGRRPNGLPSLQPGTYTIHCPKCSTRRRGSKTPSLHLKIDPDEKGAVWSCFNSGDCEWNTPQGFRVEGAGRRGSARARREYRPVPPADTYADPQQVVLDWFEARGIHRETVERNRIRSARVWMPQTQREEDVIAFPFIRSGVVVNWKYRGRNKMFRQERDAEKILFGLDDIAGQATIVITEGEPDKLAVQQVGFAAASVPDGAPERIRDDPDPDDPKFEYLRNCEHELRPAAEGGPSKIILAVDNDAPGKALEYELGRRLGLDRCYRVRWPEGCKDANEVLKVHGEDVLAECIARAEPFPIKGVISAMDVKDEVHAIYQGGLPPGAPLGWTGFDMPEGLGSDPIASLPTGMLVVLTGAPNSGKSNWWDAVMVNRARGGVDWNGRAVEPWTWGVFSAETPVSRHVIGLASKVCRKPFRAGPTGRLTPAELDNAIEWIHERFHFIHSDDEPPTVDWLCEKIRTLIIRHGIKGFVIDPYTEVVKDRSHSRDTDMAEDFITKVRSICRVHDVLGCVIAHPAKPGRDAPRVPGLYDISGSAHWNNKADLGFSVWRDRGDPTVPTEVHVLKVRFHEHGRAGTHAKLDYLPSWQGYRDAEPE